MTTLRVMNLSLETTEQDLHSLFIPYGSISRVCLMRDKLTGASRGFAYVTFRDESHARAAQEGLDCIGLNYLIMSVDFCNEF
jgi:translation initiation factor 3 subunit G